MRWAIVTVLLMTGSVALGESGDGEFSMDESLNKAEIQKDNLDRAARGILKEVERARTQRDVIKLNCLDDKWRVVKKLADVGQSALMAMREAKATGNTTSFKSEAAKLKRTTAKVLQIGKDSELCVGVQATYVGNTELEVEVAGKTIKIVTQAATEPTSPGDMGVDSGASADSDSSASADSDSSASADTEASETVVLETSAEVETDAGAELQADVMASEVTGIDAGATASSDESDSSSTAAAASTTDDGTATDTAQGAEAVEVEVSELPPASATQ